MQGQVNILASICDTRSQKNSDSRDQDLVNQFANQFEYASGAIIGRNHVLASKNNQDAYQIEINDKFIAAVVCDGCGSGKHSEVGAKLGARIVVAAIVNLFNPNSDISDPEFWQVLKTNLLQNLKQFVEIINGDAASAMEFVNDYLLFTIIGALITPSETVTFSLGDGAIAINGKLTQIPAYPNNAPPYLAYGLYQPEAINFEIRDYLPTSALDSLLIATDGIDDLIAVEDIAQFWQEDRYFKNPDAIRRKLAMLNREEVKPDWSRKELTKRSGVLSDDTSLVVLRRLLAVSD
ncbi:protein phosphatase 2C domain-containing protein [Pseudanabaena mucicola]|uniref:Protein phosphatase 2C domain-containing protein n=1 Tax=Pseudanabaena mucicola FACHB-723 TaxID=2692860 RepID=A0ABR8A039_9CYAN|nr:protein phosphatase 2C domain-containing protein [Pseudanabaena mucicola]MBD2188911.1 protein phosphatase 2C domain-containing protein [Pseudanabaena mucicola FACHB-723]